MCDDLSAPPNGRVIVTGTGVGDTARYYCDRNYEVIGDNPITCLSNGSWSDSTTCQGMK